MADNPTNPASVLGQNSAGFAEVIKSTSNALHVTQQGGAGAVVGPGAGATAQRFVLASDTGLPAGETHLGQVGGTTPRITATMVHAADATGAYTIGDQIGTTVTAASEVPITFSVGRAGATIVSGRLTGCRCTVAPGSGNLVIAAFDFDLLLFRPEASIPFAAASYPGDNAAMAITAAAMKELVAIFRFTAGNWRNTLGVLTAGGVAGYQAVSLASGRPYAPFNLASIVSGTTLLGVLQAASAWNPGNVAQTFDFALDADLD